MTLYRSELAKNELASGKRSLSQRERGALFLVNGQRTQQEVQALLQDDGSMLKKLIETGYLLVDEPAAQSQPPLPVQAQAREAVAGSPGLPPAPMPAAPDAPAPVAADNFEGKRSLATTRMFLFDICERMFARKMPALASHYRDQLREARDRASMMAIARDIIMNVEELAGAERADGLAERIAMLLPPEE